LLRATVRLVQQKAQGTRVWSSAISQTNRAHDYPPTMDQGLIDFCFDEIAHDGDLGTCDCIGAGPGLRVDPHANGQVVSLPGGRPGMRRATTVVMFPGARVLLPPVIPARF